MTSQIALRIPGEQLEQVDGAVAAGRFPNRTAATRAALDLFLRVERERDIADEYRRAYGPAPQEDWIGAAGLALGATLALELNERDD